MGRGKLAAPFTASCTWRTLVEDRTFYWAMFVSMASTSSLDRPFTKSASKPNSGGIRGRAAPGSKHLPFVAGHLPTRHCNVKTSGWPLSRVSHRSGALAKANKPPTCHTFESSNRARRVSNIGVVWSTSLDQMSGSNLFFKFLSLKPHGNFVHWRFSFAGCVIFPIFPGLHFVRDFKFPARISCLSCLFFLPGSACLFWLVS